MRLALMIEQPPSSMPKTHVLDTDKRGWVTVIDAHGTPVLRIYTISDDSLGVGLYGPLGDFLIGYTLTLTEPGAPWNVAFSR